MSLKLTADLELEVNAGDLVSMLDDHGRANPGSCNVVSAGQFIDMVGAGQLRVFDIGDNNMVLMFSKDKTSKAAVPAKQDTAIAGLLNADHKTGRGHPIAMHEILEAVRLRDKGLAWTKIAEALGRNVNKIRNRVKSHLSSLADGSAQIIHDSLKPTGTKPTGTKPAKTKRTHRLNKDEIRKIRDLRASGKTLSEIVKITGRSMATVFNNCRGVKKV